MIELSDELEEINTLIPDAENTTNNTSQSPGDVAIRELRSARDLSPDKKDAEIIDIMERYSRKVEQLVEVEKEIITKVLEDPHVKKEVLEELLNKACDSLHVSLSDRNIYSKILNSFYSRHEAVMEVLERNNYDSDSVFEELLGKIPEGQVDVVQGPSVLTFVCHDQRDFDYIVSGKYLSQKPSKVTNDELDVSNSGSGVCLPKVLNPRLGWGVTAINFIESDEYQKTYDHELSHALVNLIEHDWKLSDIYLKVSNSTNKTELTYWVGRYFEEMRQVMDSYAADELIAYFFGGREPQDIYSTLTTHPDYDYYNQEWKTPLRKVNKDLIHYAKSSKVIVNKEELKVLVNEQEKEVFVNRYQRDLYNAILAFDKLSENRGMDFARSILARESLTKWPRIINRHIVFDTIEDKAEFVGRKQYERYVARFQRDHPEIRNNLTQDVQEDIRYSGGEDPQSEGVSDVVETTIYTAMKDVIKKFGKNKH